MSTHAPGPFPRIRMRRIRRTAPLRSLVVETGLSANDLIYPVFVLDGDDRAERVESMPGIGKVRAKEIMEQIGIDENRKIKGLGSRQEAALLERLK